MNECYTMQNHTPQRPDGYQHAFTSQHNGQRAKFCHPGVPDNILAQPGPWYNPGSDRPSPDNPVSETISSGHGKNTRIAAKYEMKKRTFGGNHHTSLTVSRGCGIRPGGKEEAKSDQAQCLRVTSRHMMRGGPFERGLSNWRGEGFVQRKTFK